MVTTTGGDKLGPALQALAKKLTNAKTVNVGFPAGATEEDGTSLPMIAAIQEYGSATIPPRPFMRNTFAKHSGEWPALLEKALVATDYDAQKALGMLGEAMVGQVKEAIATMSLPPLSAITIMLRGMRSQARYRDMPFGQLIKEAGARVAAGKTTYGASQKPLIDTGHLLAGVVAEVE